MIRVESNALALLGMLGVDVGRAKSIDGGIVELPSEAFSKTSVRPGDLELASRGIDAKHDRSVDADAIALYASFAASCTKFGVGENTEQTSRALRGALESLISELIPAPGPIAGRLAALRKSIAALLENNTDQPELVTLARASYAAASEAFGLVAEKASELALRGTVVGNRLPDAWERELEGNAKTEAEIRRRAKERGGTPNELRFVADTVEKIEKAGGIATQDASGRWHVKPKAEPIAADKAVQLSKLVEALGGELAKIGALIPSGPTLPAQGFWEGVKEELAQLLFGEHFFHLRSLHPNDLFANALLSAEAQLVDHQRERFLTAGARLLDEAHANANIFTRIWMEGRDRFFPWGETRKQMLDALSDELFAKITTDHPDQNFDGALAAFAKRAGFGEQQTAALKKLANELGEETKHLRAPIDAVDMNALSAHFEHPAKDTGFYATEAGKHAMEALLEVQARLGQIQEKSIHTAK